MRKLKSMEELFTGRTWIVGHHYVYGTSATSSVCAIWLQRWPNADCILPYDDPALLIRLNINQAS